MIWLMILLVLAIFLMLDIYAATRLFLGKDFCRENFWYIIFFILLLSIIFCVGSFFIGYTLTPMISKGGLL